MGQRKAFDLEFLLAYLQKKLTSPSFLLPFALIAPYLWIGQYGITVFELLVIGGFAIAVYKKAKLLMPTFLAAFVFLYLMGYTLAISNGIITFGLAAGLGDFKVVYHVLLVLAGFYIGYTKNITITEIGTSQPFRCIIILLAVIVLTYPFLDYEMRILLLRSYFHPDVTEDFLYRLSSPRFPGLGLNAVIYSYMVYVLFLISLRTYLEKRQGLVYILLTLAIIFVLASKTSIILALATIMFSVFAFHGSIARKSLLIFVITGISVFIVSIFHASSPSDGIRGNLIFYDRMMVLVYDANSASGSTLERRIGAWEMGMERVSISPLLGIRHAGEVDSSLLGFCCPHNEFIWLWTFTGFLGLLSYLILLGWLIIKNGLKKKGRFWLVIYGSLIIQMFFDSAFSAMPFIPFFFMLVATNLREIEPRVIRSVHNIVNYPVLLKTDVSGKV